MLMSSGALASCLCARDVAPDRDVVKCIAKLSETLSDVAALDADAIRCTAEFCPLMKQARRGVKRWCSLPGYEACELLMPEVAPNAEAVGCTGDIV